MRILIAEDDFVSRRILQAILSPLGECDIVADGNKALDAFKKALDEKRPYSLICLDIMMPNMDGRDTLRNIRSSEDSRSIEGSERVKVIMTTALDDPKNIIGAFLDQCEAYLVKPIIKEKLLEKIMELGLIK